MNQPNVQPKFDPTTRATAVIGGGTLGMRISLMLASSGGEVRLFMPNPHNWRLHSSTSTRNCPSW